MMLIITLRSLMAYGLFFFLIHVLLLLGCTKAFYFKFVAINCQHLMCREHLL